MVDRLEIIRGYCGEDLDCLNDLAGPVYDACQDEMGGESALPESVKVCIDKYINDPYDPSGLIASKDPEALTKENYDALKQKAGIAPAEPEEPAGPPAPPAAGEEGAEAEVAPFTVGMCGSDAACIEAFGKLDSACESSADPATCKDEYINKPHAYDDFASNAGVSEQEHTAFENVKGASGAAGAGGAGGAAGAAGASGAAGAAGASGAAGAGGGGGSGGFVFAPQFVAELELGYTGFTYHMTSRPGMLSDDASLDLEPGEDPNLDKAEEQSAMGFIGRLGVGFRMAMDRFYLKVPVRLGIVPMDNYKYGNGYTEVTKSAIDLEVGLGFGGYFHEHVGVGAEVGFLGRFASHINRGESVGKLNAVGLHAELVLDIRINSIFSFLIKGGLDALKCGDNSTEDMSWGGVTNTCSMKRMGDTPPTLGWSITAGPAVHLFQGM